MNGTDAEARCDAARITLNKNAIPYDPQPPAIASGIRVGTPAVTTQGMGVPEMSVIASAIGEAVRDVDGTKAPAIAERVSELTSRFPAYAR